MRQPVEQRVEQSQQFSSLFDFESNSNKQTKANMTLEEGVAEADDRLNRVSNMFLLSNFAGIIQHNYLSFAEAPHNGGFVGPRFVRLTGPSSEFEVRFHGTTQICQEPR